MYEVQQRIAKNDDGSEVFTFAREVIGLTNVLQVEAGTTGLSDDEAGDDAVRTYFRICDTENSRLCVHRITDGKGHYGIEFQLKGASELESFIRALKFAVKVLEEEAMEVVD